LDGSGFDVVLEVSEMTWEAVSVRDGDGHVETGGLTSRDGVFSSHYVPGGCRKRDR
jgi:hypothetical protein